MDTVGDALIRIKNGYMARKEQVSLPYSKLVLSICKVLSAEGFILGIEDDGKRTITVTLRYEGKSPILTDLKRISKPGLRIYKGHKELPRVVGGMGIALVSTPKGVMTDKQARKEGVGGELLAYIW